MAEYPLVGLLGGTFDPIHVGHLSLAKELLTEINFSSIQLIPCHIPVHRDTPSASSQDRLNMIKLAIKNEKTLVANEIELESTTPSYTIKTLELLHNNFPDTSFCFIMGADAFATLNTWRDWKELTNYCHIIIIHRAGFTLNIPPEVDTFYNKHRTNNKSDLSRQQHGLIYFSSITPPEINATNIRAALKSANKKYLSLALPKAVLKYINKNNLYML